MRIALVSHEFPPQSGLGGVGTYIVRLASALGAAGHDVTVIAGPGSGPEPRLANVSIQRVPARYDPPVRWRPLRWLYWRLAARWLARSNPLVWHWMSWNLAAAARLAELHARWPFDVVEAPEHAGNALAAAGRWPVVARIHGPWECFYGINQAAGTVLNRALAHTERMSVRQANLLTTPSAAMADYITRRWHLPTAPRVVPNFMHVPERPPALAGDGRIVCLGRLERFKGQDILVEAFAKVAPRHPRARLILVGPDQWRPEPFAAVLHRLASDPRTHRRIHLTGPVPLWRSQAELGRASIAVVPSTGFESFSFSTLEAMAAARPIIVTDSGAMPELVDHGRCGLVVQRGNSQQLAQALDLLLRNPDHAMQLGRSAHARALARYDTSAVLPLVLHAYGRACEIAGTAPPRLAAVAPPRALAVPAA